jgi:hypothetical protein
VLLWWQRNRLLCLRISYGGRGVSEIITYRMARAKKNPSQPPLAIRSFTFTPDADDALRHLSSDASDYIGRRVSGSAIVRALLQYADRRGEMWGREELCPFVERELSSGLVWGKKK